MNAKQAKRMKLGAGVNKIRNSNLSSDCESSHDNIGIEDSKRVEVNM